jgi:hypothetical protein
MKYKVLVAETLYQYHERTVEVETTDEIFDRPDLKEVEYTKSYNAFDPQLLKRVIISARPADKSVSPLDPMSYQRKYGWRSSFCPKKQILGLPQ